LQEIDVLLSPQELSVTRERVLNNMLTLSLACIESSRQLSAALASAGRSSAEQGHKQWVQLESMLPEAAAQLQTEFWLDGLAGASRLLDEATMIFGETQKAVIRSAEVQVRIFDTMAVAAIERLRKATPWEAEPALDVMRQSLESVEQTVHELSATAIQTVDRVENEIQDAAAVVIVDRAAAARVRSPRSKKAV
jgi:hypothetical protein